MPYNVCICANLRYEFKKYIFSIAKFYASWFKILGRLAVAHIQLRLLKSLIYLPFCVAIFPNEFFLAVQQFTFYLNIAIVIMKKGLKWFMRGAESVYCSELAPTGFDY